MVTILQESDMTGGSKLNQSKPQRSNLTRPAYQSAECKCDLPSAGDNGSPILHLTCMLAA